MRPRTIIYCSVCVMVVAAVLGAYLLTKKRANQKTDSLILVLRTRSLGDSPNSSAKNIAGSITDFSELMRRVIKGRSTGSLSMYVCAKMTAAPIGSDMVEVRVPIEASQDLGNLRRIAIERLSLFGPMRLHFLPAKRDMESASRDSVLGSGADGNDDVLMPVCPSDWFGEGNMVTGAIGGLVRLSREYVEVGNDEHLIEDARELCPARGLVAVQMKCIEEAFARRMTILSQLDAREVAIVFGGTVFAYPLRASVGRNSITLTGFGRSIDDAIKLRNLVIDQQSWERLVLSPRAIYREDKEGRRTAVPD